MKVKEYPQLENLFKDKCYKFAYSLDIGVFRTVTIDRFVILNADLVDFLFFDEFFLVSIGFDYSGTYHKFVRLGRRY